MKNKGSSYIEIIICMSLLSIIGLILNMGFNIILKNCMFAKKNYYANVAAENLINASAFEIEKNNSLSNILNLDSEYFYMDKFNFIIHMNKIEHDFSISKEIFAQVNYGQEKFLPLSTEIFCDNKSIMDTKKKNYLVTVELFSKDHKFIKHLIKICSSD